MAETDVLTAVRTALLGVAHDWDLIYAPEREQRIVGDVEQAVLGALAPFVAEQERLRTVAQTAQAYLWHPEFGNVDHLFNACADALIAAGYDPPEEDEEGEEEDG